MKYVYYTINHKLRSTSSKQERLLKFVGDKKNVEKAAEGSMSKRIEVFRRAGLKKTSL